MSKRGFTLLEITISVGILAIITGIVLSGFNSYRQKELLQSGAKQVTAVLREARDKTLAGEADSVYGVHIDNNQVVLFAGTVYNSGDGNNEVTEVFSGLRLATTSLGATDVYFNRLSGEPSVSGAVTIYRIADNSASTTISISASGIVSSP